MSCSTVNFITCIIVGILFACIYFCRYLRNIQCVDENESFYYPVLWLNEVIDGNLTTLVI